MSEGEEIVNLVQRKMPKWTQNSSNVAEKYFGLSSDEDNPHICDVCGVHNIQIEKPVHHREQTHLFSTISTQKVNNTTTT